VLFIYLMALGLGISALILRDAGTAEAALLILQASIMVGLISILEHRGRKVAAGSAAPAARAAAAAADEGAAQPAPRWKPFSSNHPGKANFSGI
jgi:hypothetical protein